ncbi:MAG: HIRAN domain-containing protein [Flavimaricola sp.]|nr:HIRAN domain-containing protein [Flavimaricola sp.]
MFGFLKTLFGGQQTQAKPIRKPSNPDRTRRLSGDGKFDVKVAGTSKNQGEIKQTDKSLGSNHSGDFLVNLAPEPSNPYDANAITVKHKGNLLGYIPADLASEVHEALSDAGISGGECKAMARIVGHGKETLGIRLNIARPAKVA